jgi:cytochrome c biogenesis protein CcdA
VPLFTLVLIGLVGGLITGISPCILPVLPVIFLSGGAQSARGTSARNERAARTAGRRPYLVVAGLALSFSVFTLVGSVLLSALNLPQDVIRVAGLVVLVLLGAGMIIPRLESLLERPFSRIPQRSIDTGLWTVAREPRWPAACSGPRSRHRPPRWRTVDPPRRSRASRTG